LAQHQRAHGTLALSPEATVTRNLATLCTPDENGLSWSFLDGEEEEAWQVSSGFRWS
jgi:hypothetical protein